MAESYKQYLREHHWGIIQGVSGVYCAALATWDKFYPRSGGPIANPIGLPSGAAQMNLAYRMPFWLWAGILVFLLSFLIPAFRAWIGSRPAPNKEFKDAVSKYNLNLLVNKGALAGELFIDLELQALNLSHSLQTFLDSQGPEPEPTEPTTNVEAVARYIAGPSAKWRNHILGHYADFFAPKVRAIANQMQRAGIPDAVLPLFFEKLGDIPDIYRIQGRLWLCVLRMKGIDLKGELDQ